MTHKTIRRSLVAVAAFAASIATTFADGESLAETGGYVTTTAQLAFKGITLADLGTTYVPSAKMSGGWVTADGMPVSFTVRTVVDGAVRYQAQVVEGSVKAVAIEFTDGEGGVYARAYVDQGFYNSDLTKFGSDIYIESSQFAGEIATSADSGTYGIHNFALVPVGDLDAICINFNYSNDTMLKTYDPVGPTAYAVTGFMWSQMLGTNNNTMTGVRLIDIETSATLDLPSVTVAITGTRGTWSTGSYTSSSDVRYGYIDENENNTTPTVTVSNVPFEFYKVVFIPSTDTGDARFGYVTVNDTNYSSTDTDKQSDRDYETVVDSTAAWGKTQVADYLHGVNYLVTPVLANNNGKTLTVAGHKMSGPRGCIAAIQIVKVTIPEITATDITAAQINAAVPSGESFLKVPAGATITLDEALTASKIKIFSSGTVTLAADGQPSAEYLDKLDVSAVRGAVLRSWLEPGVVGFNFNANGARNYGGAYGTEDGASDTSLALEIGTWYKDASSREGTSTALFADGLSTLTWWSNNLYCEVENPTDGTFIQGYLDDGSSGATITLSAVPYETYDLILYCSTDTANSKFSAKTVNGAYYAWDATSGEVVEVGEITSSAAWGNSTLAAGKAVYGANTIRINGLSGALSINSKNVGGRGCIAAIQIMPAGTSTAPTMTVGTAGTATAATWTNPGLWEGGVIPSSGTAKIIVAGDVTLTIDDSVSLSAVTVEGSGSLKLVKGDGATVAFDSLSAATVQIVLPDSSISISTLSAPVKYLYKTETIASTSAGNTYTQGAGTSEAAVSIAHNGGSATLTGGTYYLAQSHSGTATTVTFHDASAEYAAECGVGMATYIVEGASAISAQRLILSQGAAGRTAAMTIKDTASVTVTGTSDVDSNQASIMFGHWNGPSTFTMQDSAAFTAASQVLVGKTANNHTININGGTFTARGIKTADGASGTNVLNMNGGLLVLGDVGITSYGSTSISVNVLDDSEIRSSAATLPITQPVAISEGATLSFTKNSDVSAAVVTLAGAVSGTGGISVGAGVTLNLGTNRPEGQITVDDDGVLTVVMANKSETPVLHVSAQPTTVKLYAVDGVTEYADATVEYDSEAGTITIKSPRPVWNATADSAFDTAGNWSTGELPGDGQDTTVNFETDTDMTVSGTYTLGDLAFTGSGDATISGEGSISASSYDFSATTGRIEYDLPTGDKSVISGADTFLAGGGSGTPTVAAGKSLTLGPWGTTEDSVTFTYAPTFAPAAGATLVFAPGEGNIQKCGGFSGTSTSTTIAVTNGTLVVDQGGSGTSKFFGRNSVRIDDGGVVSLESQDAFGWSNSDNVTINKGGVLAVKVRDTLKRSVTMNGGTIEIRGANSNRALDFHNSNIITVTDDSTIQAVDDGSVSNPTIWFRGGTTVINIDDSKTLANNVTYATKSDDDQSKGAVTIRGTMNNSTGNGVMQMNGFNDNPLTFIGTATIGENGKPVIYELNCEHQNGTYVVNAASRLRGAGSITGNGGVTLAAENSKLCGSLTVNNLTAVSGGTYGDQWNEVSAKVATSYFAEGTQTIQNGSFTIGADCVVTNAAGSTDTTDATFNIAGNANLVLGKSLSAANLTVTDGGTLTFAAARPSTAAKLTAAAATLSGTVNIVLDFGESRSGGSFYDVLTVPTSSLAGVTFSVADAAQSGCNWVYDVIGNGDGTSTVRVLSKNGFSIRIR